MSDQNERVEMKWAKVSKAYGIFKNEVYQVTEYINEDGQTRYQAECIGSGLELLGSNIFNTRQEAEAWCEKMEYIEKLKNESRSGG